MRVPIKLGRFPSDFGVTPYLHSQALIPVAPKLSLIILLMPTAVSAGAVECYPDQSSF
jgi:hypothetical protein